ncbi:hypothetical protein ACK3Z6_17125, partial [Aeromonas caviae]
MEIDKAIGLIEAHGVFHGDHYSFNSGEFVLWCQEDTHQPLSLEQANHELAPFCIRVGYAEPVRSAFFKIVVAQSCFKQPLFAPARVSRA